MIIDGKLPQGYVVICNAHQHSHSFLVKWLGPSVECPRCGRTALSAELATAFIERRAQAAYATAVRSKAWPILYSAHSVMRAWHSPLSLVPRTEIGERSGSPAAIPADG